MEFNTNTTNLGLIGGGLVSLFWGSVGWKKGWNIIPIAGGVIGISLGLLDMAGVVPLSQKISGYARAGAYQSAAAPTAGIPYDANNYYYPPRDRSILP